MFYDQIFVHGCSFLDMGIKQPQPESADVVVVGGGIMGTASTYFLANETDLDVVLVEKDHIGSGSTGDSSAILRHMYGSNEIYTKMAHWSHNWYKNFEDRIDQPIAYNDNPLVSFSSEGSEEALRGQESYEVFESLDIPASRYEGGELDSEFPMVNTEKYDTAVSDDTAGYSDGTDAATGFARAAKSLGATVLTGTAVAGFHTDSEEVSGVETEEGVISCEQVVVAAGPWTSDLLAELGVDVPILVEREQVVILDPPEEYKEEFPDLTPTTGIPDERFYIRPDFQDGVLVATHHGGEEADPESYKEAPDEEMLLELTENISEFLPGLADAGIQGQYCGLYSTTPDNDFIIDQVGPEGCYVACGFSGHGFKHGPAVGRIVSDLVAHGESDLVDTGFFSLERFSESEAGHEEIKDSI